MIFSLLVTALACELRETNEEIQSKRHVEEYINKTRPFVLDNPRYRLHYHIAPPVGWINDPAGFTYYKENYHVFYEYNPFNTSYGKTHWGHVISKDLVTWTQLPIALIPGEELCFSGSAIEVGGTLVLMYTAHKEIGYSFNETQYLAFSNDGVVFKKYVKNPVISFANNNSLDFRDPKVWRHGDRYYVVIGSRSSDDKGRVLLYKSKDMEYWEYVSKIAKNNYDLGYMWECPDFFELNGRFVLLISPQGLTNKTTDRYQNQFQVGYIIGTFDYLKEKMDGPEL